MRNEASGVLASNTVRYSQVWEDHKLLEDGLAIAPDDDILSICSAGCNVLSMLLREPRSVTAIDLNPAQSHLLSLKLAAIRTLPWDQFVDFLGLRNDVDRVAIYQQVRSELADDAREFWDEDQDSIAQGVAHRGRLETYIRGFAAELHRVHSPETVATLLATRDLEEQRRYFTETLATDALADAFRAYFGREQMAAQGRDPAQFRYVEEGDVGNYFWGRFQYVCTRLPAWDNFYLHFFLTGGYGDATRVPSYLHPDNYDRLRSLVGRVRQVTCELEALIDAHPRGTFSKLNLSDLFEYIGEEPCTELFDRLSRWVRPGGRLAFWNLLVPRASPESVRPRLIPRRDIAAPLWQRDRSWFYRDFHIEEVCEP